MALFALAYGVFRLFHHSGIGVLAVMVLLYLCVLMIAIAFLLDYPRLPRQPRWNEKAEELERRNLLVSSTFIADRAFRVHEFEEEQGPHYFLELEGGTILHLCGTYLYEYEPGEGSPRHFPCTSFTVRRHAEIGNVVDILCGGLVIEPEVEAPSYAERDFLRGEVPSDGEILHNITFDQLLQQRLSTRFRIH
jgi:hypothetical protein